MLLALNISCNSQQKQQKKVGIEIVYLVPDQPFSVERKNVILRVPDSLRGEDNQGSFIVQLLLDSTGKIVGYDLLRLTFERDNLLVCDFIWNPTLKKVEGKGDQLFLSRIAPVIQEHVLTGVKIKRNKGQKVSLRNDLRFLTRFEWFKFCIGSEIETIEIDMLDKIQYEYQNRNMSNTFLIEVKVRIVYYDPINDFLMKLRKSPATL